MRSTKGQGQTSVVSGKPKAKTTPVKAVVPQETHRQPGTSPNVGAGRAPRTASKGTSAPRAASPQKLGDYGPTGSYPQTIGKGGENTGRTNRGIAEDQQGYDRFGVRPTVRRKPQEAHTPARDLGTNRSMTGINPSTNALIRSSKKK